MRPALSRIGSLFCLIGTTLPLLHAFAGSVMPLEDTWDRTRGVLVWTNTRMTDEDIQAHARDYSFIWSTLPGLEDAFRRANPAINTGFYQPSLLDYYEGRPDDLLPGEDTPETRLRTLLWWLYEADGVGHPDWVLYRCDRVTPAYERTDQIDPPTLPNMPLDFTNPAVVDWLLERQGSFSSITALSGDLFLLHNWNRACGAYRDGQWVQLFTGEEDDPDYEAAVLNWARDVRARLAHMRSPQSLVLNFPLPPYYSDQQVRRLAANVDGILDEEAFTAWANGRLAGEDWLAKVRRMVLIQNQGAAYYSVNFLWHYPPTLDEVNWILASFLMGREHCAYIAIDDVSGGIDQIRWPHRPEYDEDIGHPCGEMVQSQGLYARDFSKGISVVNPNPNNSYTFTLPPGSFRDLYGMPIEGQMRLEPLSGAVLISSDQRCP